MGPKKNQNKANATQIVQSDKRQRLDTEQETDRINLIQEEQADDQQHDLLNLNDVRLQSDDQSQMAKMTPSQLEAYRVAKLKAKEEEIEAREAKRDKAKANQASADDSDFTSQLDNLATGTKPPSEKTSKKISENPDYEPSVEEVCKHYCECVLLTSYYSWGILTKLDWKVNWICAKLNAGTLKQVKGSVCRQAEKRLAKHGGIFDTEYAMRKRACEAYLGIAHTPLSPARSIPQQFSA